LIKDRNGVIKSAQFFPNDNDSNYPKSSTAFFKDFLNVKSSDQFREKPKIEKKCFMHEQFEQYYKGIRVEGAGYNFHSKNGKMFYANGHYVKIDDLNVLPAFDSKTAMEYYAHYKNIPLNLVIDFTSELVIKEIPSVTDIDTLLTPKLVYKIYLKANLKYNTDIGYIDAQNGKVLYTEPAFINYSATGTFDTRYYLSRQAITQYYNGVYNLSDSTRGAIIHTWNITGSLYDYNRSELKDSDNVWTSAEHSANEDDMGLDIHWALQKIYDHLYNRYGINSFDNNGYPIEANIHYGDVDDAAWNILSKKLFFGDGIAHNPWASLDIVAHEYGHGITDFQIGWAITGDPGAFNEGLSDIWAIIIKDRICPGVYWPYKFGDEIMINPAYDCIRNWLSTNNSAAEDSIADTYGSILYYTNNNKYYRSGVFSHWYYLLVEGNGSTVQGVGNDMAEDLIVEAVFNGYLRYTTTYAEIRTAMEIAATSLDSGTYDNIIKPMQNAWHAVNVGPAATTFSGPEYICNSGSSYTISNLAAGSTVTWSYSTNITGSTSGTTTTLYPLNPEDEGDGWVEAIISNIGGSYTLPRKIVSVGLLIPHISGSQDICNGNSYQYSTATDNCATYLWEVIDFGMEIVGADNSSSCNIYFDNDFVQGELHLTVSDGSNIHDEYLWIFSNCQQYCYSFSPNPASTVLIIEQIPLVEAASRSVLKPAQLTVDELQDNSDNVITRNLNKNDLENKSLKRSVTNKKNGMYKSGNETYVIEIWNETRGLISSQKSNRRVQDVDISKLNKGTYFLHIITPLAIYKEQFYVK
jgi:bacillolysin